MTLECPEVVWFDMSRLEDGPPAINYFLNFSLYS
jgi:hypothetical protein